MTLPHNPWGAQFTLLLQHCCIGHGLLTVWEAKPPQSRR